MKVGTEVSKRFLANVFGTAAGFLGTIYFARVLGASGIGILAIFQGIQSILATVTGFGMYSAVTKYVSGTNDEAQHFTSGLLLTVVSGVGTALIAVAFRGPLNDVIGEKAALLLPLAVISFSLFRLTGAFLEGKGRVALAGFLENGRYVLIVGVQTLFIVNGYGAIGLLWGLVVGQASTFLLMYVGFARVRPALPSRESFKMFSEFSRYSYVQSVASQLFKQADYVILGQFLGTSAAGIYRVSFTITEASMLFSSALASVSFPEFSRLTATDRREKVQDLFDRVMAYTAVFPLPLMVGGFVVGNDLLRTVYQITPGTVRIPLVGGVGVASLLISVLALANLLNSYRSSLQSYFFGIDRPRPVAVSALALILSYAVLVYPLTVRFESIGLAVTTTLSFLLSCLVLVSTLEYRPSRAALEDVSSQILSAGAMGIVIDGVVTLLGGASGIGRLSLVVGFGSVVYFATLLALSENIRNDVRWIARDFYKGGS